jgi:hypothetical protein
VFTTLTTLASSLLRIRLASRQRALEGVLQDFGVKGHHFDLFDFRLLPAFFNAMATACFCGLPAFFSFLMFELMVFREDPFLRGISIAFHSCAEQKS